MRRLIRFLIGVGLGAAALLTYLYAVGPEQVITRATAVPIWAAGAVLALVLAEALVDGVGIWASVKPLNDGLSARESVQYALAGDFFDTLSPAGPVSSEPIMAHFFGVATETTYSEALGVRAAAKYVKSATQLLVSTIVVGTLLLGTSLPRFVFLTLIGAAFALLVFGFVLVRARKNVSRALVIVLAPIVNRISALYRESPHDRTTVAEALERLWTRALCFRDAPVLCGLIALGAILEQLLTAAAIWIALAGTGTTVALLSIVAIVPLPQAASVVPIPASLGAYDVLLGGALAVMTVAPAAGATAAVLVVRTFGLGVSLTGGGLATGFLRGWRL